MSHPTSPRHLHQIDEACATSYCGVPRRLNITHQQGVLSGNRARAASGRVMTPPVTRPAFFPMPVGGGITDGCGMRRVCWGERGDGDGRSATGGPAALPQDAPGRVVRGLPDGAMRSQR